MSARRSNTVQEIACASSETAELARNIAIDNPSLARAMRTIAAGADDCHDAATRACDERHQRRLRAA